MMIELVLGFFSSFSNFFMKLQCDFRGLCMSHVICIFKKFVAFKCIYILSSMAEKMLMKYNKYWGDLDRVNVLMFIVVIFDPRTKLGSLEYWFKDVLSEEQCTKIVKKLKHNLQQLYDHFNLGESSSQVEHGASPQNSSFNVEETENISLSLHE
jgi:hypothetical protein